MRIIPRFTALKCFIASISLTVVSIYAKAVVFRGWHGEAVRFVTLDNGIDTLAQGEFDELFAYASSDSSCRCGQVTVSIGTSDRLYFLSIHPTQLATSDTLFITSVGKKYHGYGVYTYEMRGRWCSTSGVDVYRDIKRALKKDE